MNERMKFESTEKKDSGAARKIDKHSLKFQRCVLDIRDRKFNNV